MDALFWFIIYSNLFVGLGSFALIAAMSKQYIAATICGAGMSVFLALSEITLVEQILH